MLDIQCWIFLKRPKKTVSTLRGLPAFMMCEYKHQTLNIKYSTPKVDLTETWVFDVGYSVLDILKKDPRTSARNPSAYPLNHIQLLANFLCQTR
jgi:hypothetical protein